MAQICIAEDVVAAAASSAAFVAVALGASPDDAARVVRAAVLNLKFSSSYSMDTKSHKSPSSSSSEAPYLVSFSISSAREL